MDKKLHKEVLDRSAKLNIPPYNGFVNPILTPVMDEAGNITDIRLSQPESFEAQMLYYAQHYGCLAKKSDKMGSDDFYIPDSAALR